MPKQPQAGQIVLVDVLVAPFDERANRGRRGVKDLDPVLLDEFPKAIFVPDSSAPFVHHHGRPGRQRTVDDVAVPGDPAAIGRTPKNVFVAIIKDPLKRFLHPTDCIRPSYVECPWVFPVEPLV